MKNRFVLVANESVFDAVIIFAKLARSVTRIDSANYLELINKDSNYSLSPFTRD